VCCFSAKDSQSSSKSLQPEDYVVGFVLTSKSDQWRWRNAALFYNAVDPATAREKNEPDHANPTTEICSAPDFIQKFLSYPEDLPHDIKKIVHKARIPADDDRLVRR
jgi:hypothetical protein